MPKGKGLKMIKLYNADCYEKLKEIPDKSVDLVIIDPPYLYTTGGGGGAFGSKHRAHHAEYLSVATHTPLDDRKRKNREEIKPISSGFNYDILDELGRCMAKTNVYVWCSKAQLSDLLDYYEERGCAIDVLTWHKTNPTPTMNNTYANDTEYLVFAREKGVKVYGSYHTKRKYYVTPTNVKDKKKYGHPTIKPQYIIENLITNSSLPGGVVLDCFMGSGTTGAAAKALGRSFIGIELDEKYFNIAKKRIDEQCQQ